MSDDTLRADVMRIWPEIEWIQDADLKEKTTQVWMAALERSPLTADDLETIPFTLLAEDAKTVSFMAHKRSVVHVCRESAQTMREFYGDTLVEPSNHSFRHASEFLRGGGFDGVISIGGGSVIDTA